MDDKPEEQNNNNENESNANQPNAFEEQEDEDGSIQGREFLWSQNEELRNQNIFQSSSRFFRIHLET